MKRTLLLNRSVFAALLLSVSASVFAAAPKTVQSDSQPVAAAAPSPALLLAAVDRPSVPTWTGSTNADAATSSQGKTRAQVRAELIQAEEAGLVPAGKTDYPAGLNTIARNRINFQKAKTWWEAHGQQAASGG